MESTFTKEIQLENDQTLVISDLSRKIGEDAFVVRMEASIEIEVNEDLFKDEPVSEFRYTDVRSALGDKVIYKYLIERNFIRNTDKDQVFESLESTFMNNLFKYVSKDTFPRKFVLKEYKDKTK